MTKDEIERRLAEEPDFVYLPKFGNSLARALKRYPDGLSEPMIAEALATTVEDVRNRYQAVADKLRAAVEARRA